MRAGRWFSGKGGRLLPFGRTLRHAAVCPHRPSDSDSLAGGPRAAMSAVGVSHLETIRHGIITGAKIAKNSSAGREVNDKVQRVFCAEHALPCVINRLNTLNFRRQHLMNPGEIFLRQRLLRLRPRGMQDAVDADPDADSLQTETPSATTRLHRPRSR